MTYKEIGVIELNSSGLGGSLLINDEMPDSSEWYLENKSLITNYEDYEELKKEIAIKPTKATKITVITDSKTQLSNFLTVTRNNETNNYPIQYSSTKLNIGYIELDFIIDPLTKLSIKCASGSYFYLIIETEQITRSKLLDSTVNYDINNNILLNEFSEVESSGTEEKKKRKFCIPCLILAAYLIYKITENHGD